ncbi:hypothetical protein QPK87_17460 [Kamptonema cortianum]|nr:hypothetical protein [Geitlerinema splendidum]MDK3158342.1 hypothetical protein [Kamptonema cortianum]
MSKQSGKALIIGIVVPLVIVGAVGGLAFAGVIKIPGLNIGPKATAKAAENYGEKDDKLDVKTPKDSEVEKEESPASTPPEAEETSVATPTEPKTDPEEGAKKLAGIWNNMEAANLLAIAKNYKDEELALVLSKMEAEKVAEILGAMAKGSDAKRAALLSRKMEELGSVLPDAS